PLAQGKSVLGAKLPLPLPSRTEIEPGETKLAVTRSGLPSAFRSPMATEYGPGPVAKSVLDGKLPVPFPRSTETWDEEVSVASRSWLPSPFRSPTATERGDVKSGSLLTIG